MNHETPSPAAPDTPAAQPDSLPLPPPVAEREKPELDYSPMEMAPGPAATVEHLLKQPGRVTYEFGGERRNQAVRSALLVAVLCYLAYGLIVGMFSGGIQLVAAPLKLTLGALATALICFPSLYIFACLSGAETRLGELAGLLTGSMALTALLMMGFAPVAWVFSVSTGTLGFMGLLHLAFWVVGTWFGLRFLLRGVGRQGGVNREYLLVWAFVFVLVALQMATALRPLIGEAETLFPTERQFFLAHWFTSIAP